MEETAPQDNGTGKSQGFSSVPGLETDWTGRMGSVEDSPRGVSGGGGWRMEDGLFGTVLEPLAR